MEFKGQVSLSFAPTNTCSLFLSVFNATNDATRAHKNGRLE